jgi:hypothetical protein
MDVNMPEYFLCSRRMQKLGMAMSWNLRNMFEWNAIGIGKRSNYI